MWQYYKEIAFQDCKRLRFDIYGASMSLNDTVIKFHSHIHLTKTVIEVSDL